MFNLFMNANKKRAKKRGFTLIELVIVIVILGVLAGVAALSFQSVTGSAKDGVAKSNLRAVKSACQVYQVDNDGKLPNDKASIEKYLDKELQDAWKATSGDYIYSLEKTTSGSTTTGIVIMVKGGGLPEDGYKFEITGPVKK